MRLTVGGRFRRRFFRGSGWPGGMALGFLRLHGLPVRAGNDKPTAHGRRFCRGTALTAISMIARYTAPRRMFSLQHKLFRRTAAQFGSEKLTLVAAR
jgi:hypothetical protein